MNKQIMIVCKFCAAPVSQTSSTTVTVLSEELDEWKRTGKRPETMCCDGMGERDLTPAESPIEAAYRRGVFQAFSEAQYLTPKQLQHSIKLAGEWRFDSYIRNYYLHILSGAVMEVTYEPKTNTTI